MRGIASPKTRPNRPEFQVECEFCLEPAFQALVEQAVAAGWPRDLVGHCLMSLANNDLEAQEAKGKIEKNIAILPGLKPRAH